jgi:hypothetical protein
MSGRRSHQRFEVSPSSHGTLRVNRDIVVKQVERGELHVISREPGVRDERMLVQFPDEDPDAAVRVRVLDSKPIVVQGAVRHLLRLHVIGASGRADDGARVRTSQEGGGIDG